MSNVKCLHDVGALIHAVDDPVDMVCVFPYQVSKLVFSGAIGPYSEVRPDCRPLWQTFARVPDSRGSRGNSCHFPQLARRTPTVGDRGPLFCEKVHKNLEA